MYTPQKVTRDHATITAVSMTWEQGPEGNKRVKMTRLIHRYSTGIKVKRIIPASLQQAAGPGQHKRAGRNCIQVSDEFAMMGNGEVAMKLYHPGNSRDRETI